MTTTAAAETCRRTGCDGGVDEDGYCERCGHKAATPPAPGGGALGSTGSSGRTGAGVLGTGLADLPPVPARDPTGVVLADPAVPESARFCGKCGHPVGRGRRGRPGLTGGFCPHDGAPFSFTPALKTGDLVAGQYQVQGCLAHGGLGWIYLAADRNLDGRWVVLKGLIDTTDPEALAAAEAERRFLIAVDHPNIVNILNFVQHREPGAGALHGYLVMEYVGGASLQDLFRQHLHETGGPLPLRQAIPYALEVLKAFGYLHGHGMLYCDLKPANLIQVGDRLKLIDLGAVRMAGDQDSDIWGTVGYQAPEVPAAGPSVRSDLYTVGRTLAVLGLAFSPALGGPDGPREAPLPDPAPGDTDSFHRFLRRATDPDPDRRFASAAEMADQLSGVLREIRAAEDGIPYPAPSTLFGPERGAAATALAGDGQRVLAPLEPAGAVAALPVPLPAATDPAASALAGLAGLVGRRPEELLALVESLPATPEARLAKVRLLVEQGAPEARAALAAASSELAGDWRVGWYEAVHALATGRAADAVPLFDRCLSWLPGECAPKLALAFSLECAGQPAPAAGWYQTVWRTDRGFVSAAFGSARTGRDATGLLDQVPAASTHYPAAQLALVAAAVRGPASPTVLTAAGDRLGALAGLPAPERAAMAAEVWEAALALLAGGGEPQRSILGAPMTGPGVRQALEAVYRELARSTTAASLRRLLVDRANTVRPRTWL